MKKIIPTLITTLFVTSATLTEAMNYSATNTDVLLVFREDNFNDMAFNLGSVSNLLALPNGTTTNLSYNTNLVKANFNNTFTGVKFILMAATDSVTIPGRYWITAASPTAVVSNLTVSPWGTVRGKIESVGNAATASTASNAAPYIVAASDQTAYSYIVTDGNGSSIGTFNGSLKFTCEADAGSVQTFWQANPTNTSNIGPGKRVGLVTMNLVSGTITYTAGTNTAVTLVPARIVNVIRTNGVSRVNFATTNGNNYRLLFSTNLAAWITNTAVGTLAGNNATNTFLDTNGTSRVFYRIQSF